MNPTHCWPKNTMCPFGSTYSTRLLSSHLGCFSKVRLVCEIEPIHNMSLRSKEAAVINCSQLFWGKFGVVNFNLNHGVVNFTKYSLRQGVPNIELNEQLYADEEERVRLQIKTLGPEGLKSAGDKVKRAIDRWDQSGCSARSARKSRVCFKKLKNLPTKSHFFLYLSCFVLKFSINIAPKLYFVTKVKQIFKKLQVLLT